MKRIIIFLLLFAALKVAGQTTGYLRFDTVKIMKQNGACELYLINKTKDSLGLLTNIGGGLTQFKKPKVLSDSTFIIGNDTLKIIGRPGTNLSLTNVGTGFRLATTPNGSIKSIVYGYGVNGDSTTNANSITVQADTTESNHLVTTSQLKDTADAIRAAGAGPGNTFTVGSTTPSNSSGSNGDYYFQQNKSWLYKKSTGSWGTPIGYLYTDTLQPIDPDDTTFLSGTMVNLPGAWDPRTYIFNSGSFLRNRDAVGNSLLGFKDDAVRFNGWNVSAAGTRINTNEAANYHQWESHFDTRQIGDSAFEHHKVHLFVPGSPGATLFPTGIRVWSENTSKSLPWSQVYYTGNEFKWRWKKDVAGGYYDWMTAYPGGLELTMPIKIDSITDAGGTFMVMNNRPIWRNETFISRPFSLLTNNVGFRDTTWLFSDLGSFVINNRSASGFTIFDASGGVAFNNGTASIWGINANGQMVMNSQSGTNGTFDLSFHNSAYGITLNKASNRNAYLDIASDPVAAASYNNYFRFNITDPDSVDNPLRLIFEKLRGGSFTTNTLQNTRGFEISLNDVSTFGTQHTANTAPDGKYTADFVWSSKRAGPKLERMRLTDTGYLVLKYIDSTANPVNMIYQDTDGTIKKAAVPGGITSINSKTGPAITIQSGTATSIDNSVSNTITVNVTPSSNSIPHTLDVQYTTAGNTGTGETDLFSYTLQANKLAIDGRTVNFEIDGEFNDNTITAQLRLYFAGNVTLNTGAVSVSTAFTKWKLTGYIMRTSSSTAHVTYELQCPGLATAIFLGYSNLTSLDFTTTNVFKISAQAAGGGASNSDITAHSWQLLYKPQTQ